MKTRIVRIGNSRGIRIPKALLEQTGLSGDVELHIQEHALLIKAVARPRAGWDQAFKTMAERGDDVVFLGAPFEMVASYGLAFTFGLVGLWPLWFMAFMLSTPVLRALAEHPNLDDLRRPLYATMLAYTERYGLNGRFSAILHRAFVVAVLNAAVLPASIILVRFMGYSNDPTHVSPTVLFSAGWIFAIYVLLLAWSVHIQNRFARIAEERGYPLRELTRRTVRATAVRPRSNIRK